MKTIAIKTIVLSLLLITSFMGIAQDTIYQKNEEIIICTITELGENFEDNVKYTQEEMGALVFSIDKGSIDRIVLRNGRELTFKIEQDSFTPELHDKIYRKNKDIVICKITELGEDEIKYTMDETGALVFAIDKDLIEKVVLQSGKTLTFKNKMIDPEYYADNNKNAFKFGMFNPLANNLKFGYERSLKPGRSFEVAVGFGFGENAGAVNLKAGYKFILTPDFYLKGMRYSHILKGYYFRPAINLGTNRYGDAAGMVGLDWGRQIVLSNVFLIDYFIGAGFGFGESGWYDGFGNVGEGSGFAGSVGLNIGFLIK